MTERKPSGRPRKDREHDDKDDTVRALLAFISHILKRYGLTYSMLAPAVARKTGKTKQAAVKMVGRQLGGTQKKKIDRWILDVLFEHVPGDARAQVREEGTRLYLEAYPESAPAAASDETVVGEATLEGEEHPETVPATAVHEMVRQVNDFLATAATVDHPAPDTAADIAAALQTPPDPLEPAPAPPAGTPAAAGSAKDLETLTSDLRTLWSQLKQRQQQHENALQRLVQARAERRMAMQRHRAYVCNVLRAARIRPNHAARNPLAADPYGSDPDAAVTYPARWLLPLVPFDPPPALPDPLDDLPPHPDQQMALRLRRVIAGLQWHADRLWREYDEAVRQHAIEVALHLESEHHVAEYLNDLTAALRQHHAHQGTPVRRLPMRRILGPASEQTHRPIYKWGATQGWSSLSALSEN